MAGLTESVGVGLLSGYKLGSAIQEKKQGALEAKKQELLGGLARSSLGLGGEDEQQQFAAQKQFLAADPEKFKIFQEQVNNLKDPEFIKMKERNEKLGLASSNLQQLTDEELPSGLFQTYKVFNQMGETELAQQALELMPLAQNDPRAFRQRLSAIEAQSLEVKDIFDTRQKKAGGIDSDSVQSSRILADGTTIVTMKSGGTEVLSSEGQKLTGSERTRAISAANEEEIRIAGGRSKAVSESSKIGSQLGQFQNDINTWEVTKTGVESAFPDIAGILEQAPDSSFSNAVSKYVSMTIGNTEGQDAQAQIQQIGSLLLQTVPIPPGPQSEIELKNRQQTYGDLSNPDISVPTKVKLIENYFKFQEAKANAAQEKITGKKKTVMEPKVAPSQSVMWLEQNNTAENRKFFKEKYGYLPEGY